ncbi:MAG: hypothetical protein AB7V42_12940 [Thermoleophilia bacterium]
MTSPDPTRPPAVVLQASGPNSLGIIRSLGREGVPVIACDHDPRALGLRSRYARPWHTRDALTDPDGFIEDLLALGRTLPQKGVLFATHDEAVTAVGPREDEVGEFFHRPWSPWPVMSRIVDKSHQHAVARSIGFPVPATVEPADLADVEEAGRSLRFPLILKPRQAPEFRRRFRTQVFESTDIGELRRHWELAAPYEPQLSEVIPGGDERIWSLGSYRGANGERLASFTGRKLRQWPPRFGTGRAAEASWDPDYAERGHALLDALGYHGISQLETKRDPRDGRDYLIEVNTRSWLWVGLATLVDVNLPLAAYLDAIGRPRRWPEGHRGNMRWILSTKHLVAGPREIVSGRWTLGEFAASIRPPFHDGVFELRDPRPALALVRRHARRLRVKGTPGP